MTPRILVIGFNRCGTLSLHKFFKRNGVTSIHYNVGKRIVPIQIFANLSLGRPLLQGLDDFQAVSDMGLAWPEITFEVSRLFRDLHRDYPDAYFVLNTRPVDNWIASRMMHLEGDYARRYAQMYDCTEADLASLWAEQYAAHHDDVRTYFAGHDRFLEFDIESGDPAVLSRFLEPDYRLHPRHWGRSNETREFLDDPGQRRRRLASASHVPGS